jgi:ADP-ribose pyrophosphatase
MDERDVEIVSLTPAYRGFLNVDVYKLRHRLFAGGWGPVVTREVMERSHAVCAIPYDPVRDRIVLIEQFRVGAFAAKDAPWMVECVAGMRALDEDPADVVRREIREETGLETLDLVRAGRAFSSPGGTTESVEMFVARVDSSAAAGVHGLAHEGEDIRVFTEDFRDGFASFFDGRRVGSSFTVMTLQWLALNRDGLRARWEKVA